MLTFFFPQRVEIQRYFYMNMRRACYLFVYSDDNIISRVIF